MFSKYRASQNPSVCDPGCGWLIFQQGYSWINAFKPPSEEPISWFIQRQNSLPCLPGSDRGCSSILLSGRRDNGALQLTWLVDERTLTNKGHHRQELYPGRRPSLNRFYTYSPVIWVVLNIVKYIWCYPRGWHNKYRSAAKTSDWVHWYCYSLTTSSCVLHVPVFLRCTNPLSLDAPALITDKPKHACPELLLVQPFSISFEDEVGLDRLY